MKETSRFEVWKDDLLVAAHLRQLHGLQSTGLFHRALRSYCHENGLDYDKLQKELAEKGEPITERVAS